MASVVGRHLSAMAEVVTAHGGTIDKFQGDAVMAVFGAPEPVGDHAERALRCAIAMQARQAELNAGGWSVDGIAAMGVGIGVNTGRVIAGTVGGGGPPRVHGRRRRRERRVAAAERGRRAARSWRRRARSPRPRRSRASRSASAMSRVGRKPWRCSVSSSTADAAALPPERSPGGARVVVVRRGGRVVGRRPRPSRWRLAGSDVDDEVVCTDLVFVLAFPMVGVVVLIASRRPENSLGWLMVMGIGLVRGPRAAQGAYASWTIYGDLPFAAARRSPSADPGWVPVHGRSRASCCCCSPTATCRRRGGDGSRGRAVGMVASSIVDLVHPGTFVDSEYPERAEPDRRRGARPSSSDRLCSSRRRSLVVGGVVGLILRYAADDRRRRAAADPLAGVRPPR